MAKKRVHQPKRPAKQMTIPGTEEPPIDELDNECANFIAFHEAHKLNGNSLKESGQIVLDILKKNNLPQYKFNGVTFSQAQLQRIKMKKPRKLPGQKKRKKAEANGHGS